MPDARPHYTSLRMLPSIGAKRRLFLRGRVVSFFDGRMPQRPEGSELSALLLSGHKRDLDTGGGHVASVEAEPCVGIRPALGKLRSVAGRRRPVDADAIHSLSRCCPPVKVRDTV